jgi:hypothetical protein
VIKDDVLSDRNFLKQEDEEMNASIRRATSTGRPLSSEGFINKLDSPSIPFYNVLNAE